MCTHMSGFDGVYYPRGMENEVVRDRGRRLCFLQSADIQISTFRTHEAPHGFGYEVKGSRSACECVYVACGWECFCSPGSCGQMYGHGLQVRVSRSRCQTDEEDISSLPSRFLRVCVHPCAAVCAGGRVRVDVRVRFELDRAGGERPS